MFSKDKNETPKTTKLKTMERNVIAKNTTIKGEIISDGDFRIDGILEGELKTQGRVIIGAGGFVQGTIQALNADVEGRFSGELNVEKTLTVKAIANISGDVIVGKLSIEPGATFNASCVMKVVPKEVKKEDGKKTKQEQ
ncbi:MULTISPECIES: polymer-forming cytoskeletal protein [unclassified Polaribacter]|uniref:bactofilin family protein n=1 Tax=unclassified Polaribacter TaxID=196858 RepID=UPI0011BF0C4E|nr:MULTISPECIES: polymer-forming cytoskeletal protein [unclassified Polaribacter]TXD50589.1 polymer-forming cytoskeletal protein [Polaribacter sp. IC063]TXD61722.1 polymer-forming cytoskeletal protein [Polaribacter sp. IC066]